MGLGGGSLLAWACAVSHLWRRITCTHSLCGCKKLGVCAVCLYMYRVGLMPAFDNTTIMPFLCTNSANFVSSICVVDCGVQGLHAPHPL